MELREWAKWLSKGTDLSEGLSDRLFSVLNIKEGSYEVPNH
jgi:hypothetical protein